MIRKLIPALVTIVVLTALENTVAAEKACLIPGRGFFRIYADAGGLFSVFAHDHLIEAGKIDGCAAVDLKNPLQSSVQLSFSTAELKVLDPKESAEDRAKVQKTMETDVLRIREYPKVTFDSTAVTADSGGRYRVSGNLTIRGKASPVVIPITTTRLDDGSYKVVGSFKFKQTTFGIEPIKLIGGTVRVKDEIRTEWELYLK